MLTERIIRDAKPSQKLQILWDSQVKGLGLRITPKGVKSFILNYRVSGKERRATLGRAAEISLKDVRVLAAEQLTAIRAGADPLERKKEALAAPTVKDGLEKFFGEFAPNQLRLEEYAPKTINEYRKQAERYMEPSLGKIKITDVKRSDIERMAAPLPKIQRNRVLAFTSRLFNLFEQWEWRQQRSNPCFGVQRAREDARDRVLSESEMAALSRSLKQHEKQHPASVAAIRVAALTGLRIGEVISMQWEHIDFETGRLTLPETKTGKRQTDLPEAALALLSEIPRTCEYCFSVRSGRPTSYKSVWRHFLKIAAAAGIEGVTPHDLRRSYMTNAARAGIGVMVLRDLLGHKSSKVAERYVRDLGQPVREAREEVGAAMAAMMDGDGEESGEGED